MDSIERMRKINNLTKELKSHGFAESSFEAIEQANQIYGNNSLDKNVAEAITSSKENQGEGNTMTQDNTYIEKKVSKLSDNVDILTNKLNEIIRAINDLDARILEVKTKQDKIILTLNSQPNVAVQRPAQVEQRETPREEPRREAQTSTQQSTNTQSRKDDSDPNQRTGSFGPQDVAIDKMFYFGKK